MRRGLRCCLFKGLDTRDQLLEFHGKHYHAANMALVVLGKEDLDHLEGWARECFKEVGPSITVVRWLQKTCCPPRLQDALIVTSRSRSRLTCPLDAVRCCRRP